MRRYRYTRYRWQIYHTASPLIKKYREFANILERSKNQETFYYTGNGNIYRFVGQVLAENEGKYIIKGAIHNISSDKSLRMQHSVDNKLKELSEHVSYGFWEKLDDTHTVVRFATDWATTVEDIDTLFKYL